MKYLLFIGLIALSFIVSLGVLPLFDVDEGAFAQSSREMLLRGDFLTTYLYGELRFDKPILIYWLQACSMSVFGESAVAVRLPSLLATLLWLYLIVSFVTTYAKADAALTTAIIFVATFIISVMSIAATADMLLNAMIAGTMLYLYRYYDQIKQGLKSHALYIATLFMALGVLTKGPVAIMIPVVVMGIFLVVKGEYKLLFSSAFNLKAIALFVIIAAPWYVLEYMEQGQKFIDGFILKHNVARFNNAFEQHSGGYYYYLLILPLITLPFTATLLSSVGRIRAIFNSDLYTYLFIWFSFVLVFFSFAGTKLPHYIVYGMTPLFILGGLSHTAKTRAVDFVLLVVVMVGLAMVPELLIHYEHTLTQQDVALVKDELFAAFDSTYQLIMVGLTIGLIIGWFLIKEVQYKMIFMAIIFTLIINLMIMPIVASLEQQPIKQLAQFAKKSEFPAVKTYKLHKPSFSFYSGIITSRDIQPGDIVFTKEYHLDAFAESTILQENNGYYLIKLP